MGTPVVHELLSIASYAFLKATSTARIPYRTNTWPRTPSWWCEKPLRIQAQMDDTGAIVQATHLDSFFRTVRYPRYRVHCERDVAATLIERSCLDS